MKKDKYILSNLALGDFVIDCFFMKKLNYHFHIIAPESFRPLAQCLGVDNQVLFFESNEKIPPKIFSVKSSMFREIISSFVGIRRSIKEIIKGKNIIIPHKDIRWKILIKGLNPAKVSYICNSSQNIYAAYIKFFSIQKKNIYPIFANKKIKKIFIFPDSRQSHKVLSIVTLENILGKLRVFSLDITLCSYKKPRMLNSNIHEEVYNSFDDLTEFISSSDLVITADSLPLHLAYFHEKNVFVISDKLNSRLFPENIIQQKNFCTFNDWTNFDNLFKKYDCK